MSKRVLYGGMGVVTIGAYLLLGARVNIAFQRIIQDNSMITWKQQKRLEQCNELPDHERYFRAKYGTPNENITFGDSSLDNITFDNSSVDNITFGDSSVDNITFGDSSVDNITFDNSSVDNITFDNSSVDNITFDNSSVNNILPSSESAKIISNEDIRKDSGPKTSDIDNKR